MRKRGREIESRLMMKNVINYLKTRNKSDRCINVEHQIVIFVRSRRSFANLFRLPTERYVVP